MASRTLLLLLVGLSSLRGSDVTARLDPPGVRRPAPSFALLDGEGRRIKLSRFKGKPVLLDLWATNCGGCIKEIPYFIDLHRAYGRNKLSVVGVSMDILYEDLKGPAEAWSLVKPFVAARSIEYPILMGDDAFTKNYSVSTLPVTYLIDKRGRIAATYTGVVDRDDIRKNIQTLASER